MLPLFSGQARNQGERVSPAKIFATWKNVLDIV